MGQNLLEYVKDFQNDFGTSTQVGHLSINGILIPQFINEFWTAKQRQASSLHEVSYRACFKPQLPRFFIKALTKPGDLIYDPFSGRGTTVIEAALLGRNIAANDINPLSRLLAEPRLGVPKLKQVEARLDSIEMTNNNRAEIDLSMFFHPRTEREIVGLRYYLLERETLGELDDVDKWIRMVATTRLTGHSPGFFSVYTLPPNQAVSPQRQIKINLKRNQVPEYRDIKSRILRKSKSLVKDLKPVELANLRLARSRARFLCKHAQQTPELDSDSVKLTVTSPPFLKVVQYTRDNWLRCWFNGIDAEEIEADITATSSLDLWNNIMQGVFAELYRITSPGGWVAFEVGEVNKGTIKLDQHVVPLGIRAGFQCAGILLNIQEFTKTSNIWGVKNNSIGTNTNRIVLLYKE